MHVNKFNIHWQIARCEAKMLASVDDKCQHVLRFLDQNPCIQNYHRVLVWFQTAKLGYSQLERATFDWYLKQLHVSHYTRQVKQGGPAFSLEDMPNDLSDIATEDLQMVRRDLSKRKYGFQYAGCVPQQHVEFMESLTREIERRNNGGSLGV